VIQSTQPTEIKNTNSTLRWVEDGIVHIEWKPKTDIEITDIDELEISFNVLTQGQFVCVVSDLRDFVNISIEARNYAAEKSPKLKGIAYVISGLSQRIMLRFYIKLRKRKNPAKVFQSFDEAVEWLRTL